MVFCLDCFHMVLYSILSSVVCFFSTYKLWWCLGHNSPKRNTTLRDTKWPWPRQSIPVSKNTVRLHPHSSSVSFLLHCWRRATLHVQRNAFQCRAFFLPRSHAREETRLFVVDPANEPSHPADSICHRWTPPTKSITVTCSPPEAGGPCTPAAHFKRFIRQTLSLVWPPSSQEIGDNQKKY